MGLLVKDDYFTLIQAKHLEVITESDDSFIAVAEQAAEVEMISYLNSRYDVALLFPPTLTYTIGVTFAIGDFVYLKADAFVMATIYAVGDLVSFTDGNVYKCILTTDGTQDPDNGTYFELWGVNKGFYTSLVAEAGAKPADPAKFTFGDTRNQLIIRYLVDLVLFQLHSRINPRNIPDLRVERQENAVTWLSKVANPRNDMSPNFPLKTHPENQDNTVVWGGNDKQTHGY